jgi:hypothetical protein
MGPTRRGRQSGQAVVEFALMCVAAVILIGFVRSLVLFELDVFNRLNVVYFKAYEQADKAQKEALLAPEEEGKVPVRVKVAVVGGPMLRDRPVPLLPGVDWDSPALRYAPRDYTVMARTYPRQWPALNSGTSWWVNFIMVYGILSPL